MLKVCSFHTQACIATIVGIQQKRGIKSTSLLNFVVSDGCALIATRVVSPASEQAASLYYAEGELQARGRCLASCGGVFFSMSV